jgi:gluconokinase
MVVVVMGVSGAGKTVVGRALAARLGWRFADADDFHPAANVEKMRRGVPLSDADREPWIRELCRAVADWTADGRNVVLAWSALRRRHRDAARAAAGDAAAVRFVHLAGSSAEIEPRMRGRVGHFMPAALLRSQLDTLEPPDASEALRIGIDRPVAAIVERIVVGLGLPSPA